MHEVIRQIVVLVAVLATAVFAGLLLLSLGELIIKLWRRLK